MDLSLCAVRCDLCAMISPASFRHLKTDIQDQSFSLIAHQVRFSDRSFLLSALRSCRYAYVIIRTFFLETT